MSKLFRIENSPFYEETLKGTIKSKLEQVDYDAKQDTYISKRVIYKSDEYVKYVIPKDINITEYHNLSKLSTTLLHYIITTKLEYNTPTFRFKVKEFAAILNLTSLDKVYKSIRELISTKYISKTKTKEVYWINHNRFYKGNYITIKKIIQK